MSHLLRRCSASPAVGRRIVPWLLVAAFVIAGGLSLDAPSPAHALARLAQCTNNLDDDLDGKIDFRQEPGCNSANDANEADPVPLPACSDRADNDLDGKTDFPTDPGCPAAGNNNEGDPASLPACSDGVDNTDADGKIDYPADPGCNWAADNSEADRACSDDLDNDADGKADFPSDFGCDNVNDMNESDPPQCNDGRDNDGDGTLDADTNIATQSPDSDCLSAVDAVEAPALALCADGVDNDADGKTDYPADPGCLSAADDDETDTQVFFVLPSSVQAPLQTPLLTPFPIVRLRGRTDRGRVRITLLTVRAPEASQVSIYCTGRSCPRKRLAIRAGKKVVRVRQFERRLRGGTVLKIYVTKPGFVGKYTRFRFMSKRVPLRADRCANTPGTQPRDCPAS